MIDSGATVSCISKKFCNRLKLIPQPISPEVTPHLLTADNSELHILGCVDLTINVYGLLIPYTFLVLDSLFHSCVLGLDFLEHTHSRIDFASHLISIYDDLVVCSLVPFESPDAVVTIATAVLIPAMTEVLVKAVLPRNYRPQSSIVECLPSLKHRLIGVARSIIEPKGRITVCRLINPSDHKIRLKKGTPIASIQPIDLNDPANQHIKHNQHTGIQHQHFINRLSEPTNTVTHEAKLATLSDLGIPLNQGEMSAQQYEQLIHLLYTNRDIFAQSLNDLPGCDLVKHKIELTSDQPIRQRQFRQSPHLENEIEKHVETSRSRHHSRK